MSSPRLYDDLADWWPLLSAPAEYAAEAELYREHLLGTPAGRPRRVLELGSGGGNNASHLKANFELTLVDRSPSMLEVSRRLNPECEHLLGDMRSIRLDRDFDAVFVHDAVTYMTTLDDLSRAIETAAVHCRPGGRCLFVPDAVRETFQPFTGQGGHDGPDGRALRYLEWVWDPDPEDHRVRMELTMMLRTSLDAEVEIVHDSHDVGLFGVEEWVGLLRKRGLIARWIHTEGDEELPGGLFVADRPAA